MRLRERAARLKHQFDKVTIAVGVLLLVYGIAFIFLVASYSDKSARGYTAVLTLILASAAVYTGNTSRRAVEAAAESASAAIAQAGLTQRN